MSWALRYAIDWVYLVLWLVICSRTQTFIFILKVHIFWFVCQINRFTTLCQKHSLNRIDWRGRLETKYSFNWISWLRTNVSTLSDICFGDRASKKVLDAISDEIVK